MRAINALSLTEKVKSWLASSHHPHILHVFEDVCNLINEQGQVLSIVAPGIGNGPFNLVLEEAALLNVLLHADSKISVQARKLTLENLTINLNDARLWLPRPDWETLHAIQDNILSKLTTTPVTDYQPALPTSLCTTFSIAMANAEIPSALHAAQKLAGLGQGLTPSGDDFILGAVLAAWIIHPLDVAGVLAEEITNIAAPLTTSLAAAWLRSAGQGEAGILWHNFFDALIAPPPTAVPLQLAKLLSVGQTSGADAFAGFLSTLIHHAEAEKK